MVAAWHLGGGLLGGKWASGPPGSCWASQVLQGEEPLPVRRNASSRILVAPLKKLSIFDFLKKERLNNFGPPQAPAGVTTPLSFPTYKKVNGQCNSAFLLNRIYSHARTQGWLNIFGLWYLCNAVNTLSFSFVSSTVTNISLFPVRGRGWGSRVCHRIIES